MLVDSDEASLAIAQANLEAMSSKVKKYSESVKGHLDLIYLNYAAASQDPLGSYGVDQVSYFRDVTVRYDPTGVFQRRIPRKAFSTFDLVRPHIKFPHGCSRQPTGRTKLWRYHGEDGINP